MASWDLLVLVRGEEEWAARSYGVEEWIYLAKYGVDPCKHRNET
jgi:hypothetical protein